MFLHLLFPSLLSITALVATAPLSAADCPTNFGSTTSSAGDYDYQSTAPTWDFAAPCGRWRYDLPAGSFSVTGGGAGGEYSCYTSVRVSDIYQVVGPPTGTPLSFQARMVYTGIVTADTRTYPYIGTICNSTAGTVKMTSGSSTNTFAFRAGYPDVCENHPINGDGSIDLAHIPGEPFLISFEFQVHGRGDPATVNSALSFTGLPAGYALQSCQDYAGAPVPAFARSWGSLKHTYR